VRIAIIHYWLVKWRGGEKVLKAIADLFPDCDIYTHVFDPEIAAREFPNKQIRTTFISRLPFARRLYQRYLPLMPLALEQLDLRDYDLVISSESGPAKGVVLGPQTEHVCFCHSPMRYAWDMYHEYRSQTDIVTYALMAPLLSRIRQWDQVSAQRVDRYVANSGFVASRIWKYYRRRSVVIYPPVAVEEFEVSTTHDGFYLSVGQLVPYKRADLLVQAFNSSGKRLVIVGEGALLKKLRRVAKANVELVGWQSAAAIRNYYARCRALIFPGVEDFGIVPVEAMATGKPVIALAKGGALETIIDGVTGVFFDEQSAQGIVDAVHKFEAIEQPFDPAAIRARAEMFSSERFAARFKEFIDTALAKRVDEYAQLFDKGSFRAYL
jgi:glycosyltransferase involved in cell wall biosynthesis